MNGRIQLHEINDNLDEFMTKVKKMQNKYYKNKQPMSGDLAYSGLNIDNKSIDVRSTNNITKHRGSRSGSKNRRMPSTSRFSLGKKENELQKDLNHALD